MCNVHCIVYTLGRVRVTSTALGSWISKAFHASKACGRFLGHIIHRACTDRWKRTDFLRYSSMDCNKLAAGSIFKLWDRGADFLGLRGANSRFKGDERRRVLNRTTTTAIKYCQEDRARCSRLASFVLRPRRKLSFKPKTALNILWYGIQAAGGRNGK